MDGNVLPEFGNEKKIVKEDLRCEGQNFPVIRHSKAVYHKDVQLNSCTFEAVSFENVRILGSLCFRGCRFGGRLDFRNIRVEGQVSFIDCTFDTAFLSFELQIKGALQFHECTANAKIEIRNSDVGRLDIERACDFDCLVMEGEERRSQVSEINISGSTIRKKAQFSRISGVTKLAVINVNAGEICLRNVDIAPSGQIAVTQSALEKMEISGGDMQRINAAFVQSNFSISFCLKPNSLDGAKVDLSTSGFGSIELLEKCYEVVRSPSRESILFNDKPDDYRQRIDTLRLLNQAFQVQLRYELQDACLFLLKDFEVRERIANAYGRLEKFKARVLKVLGREFLGWGVSLGNIFKGYFVVYLLFVWAYFLGVDAEDLRKVTIVDMEVRGEMVSAVLLATVNQVGLFADTHVAGKIYYALGIFQHTLSILYVTLLTGVVIRKLVR